MTLTVNPIIPNVHPLTFALTHSPYTRRSLHFTEATPAYITTWTSSECLRTRRRETVRSLTQSVSDQPHRAQGCESGYSWAADWRSNTWVTNGCGLIHVVEDNGITTKTHQLHFCFRYTFFFFTFFNINNSIICFSHK